MTNTHEVEVGDVIIVRGYPFVLVEMIETLNKPAVVIFKQPSELTIQIKENP